ncbi:MAG: ABC transporter permease [Cyclobacteriaceae bacterium]
MLNDLKFTLRRIFKNKLGTVINTLGLTIGIFVSVILLNYIVQESTYDHHHEKADRIHKLISKVAFSKEGTNTFGISVGTIAEEYKEKFPQVENTTRLYGPFNMEVDLKENRLNNNSVLFVDYSFFELFDFPEVQAQAFNSINQAVISREFSEKLSSENPVGMPIKIEGVSYLVSHVVDIPYNTMFQFDVIVPLHSDPFFEEIKDGGLEFETYVLLSENSNNASTLATLAEYYNDLTERKWELFESDNYLLPLKDVYLDTSVRNKLGNGNKQLLTIILTIAILVLGLALINYINLQVANNHSRMPELRLKKIMGAGRRILIKQSIMESLLIICLSGITSILLLNTFYGTGASQLLGNEILTLEHWSFQNWVVFTATILLVGIIAGVIPSLKLFNLKSITQQEVKQKRLGKLTVSLVVFQFLVTTSLLTTILFVNYQMDFLKNQPTGYNSEQVVMVNNLNDSHKENYQQIKTRLEQHSTILSIAGTQSAPGNGASGQFVHRIDKSSDEGISIAHIRTINGYAETLELEFISGGDFTITSLGGETQFILNESAASKLFADGTNPINQVVDMSGRVGKVVGVVQDFHYRSFHHKVNPLAINIEEPYNITLMAKIAPENIQSSLGEIEAALSAVDPLYVFDYQFLDDQFDQSYKSEIRTKTIITYATIIAFSISIMGLLALSIFVINSKIKEIAIRKTLGGSHAHIFWKLSVQLMSWIIIGNILSIPISYFVAESWVQDFIYQVSLSNLLWMGPVSTLLTLTVALAAITRKLYKTMVLNPVEFLRNE